MLLVHMPHKFVLCVCVCECEMKKKQKNFWGELGDMLESLPKEERLVIGADFYEHVGNLGD